MSILAVAWFRRISCVALCMRHIPAASNMKKLRSWMRRVTVRSRIGMSTLQDDDAAMWICLVSLKYGGVAAYRTPSKEGSDHV